MKKILLLLIAVICLTACDKDEPEVYANGWFYIITEPKYGLTESDLQDNITFYNKCKELKYQAEPVIKLKDKHIEAISVAAKYTYYLEETEYYYWNNGVKEYKNTYKNGLNGDYYEKLRITSWMPIIEYIKAYYEVITSSSYVILKDKSGKLGILYLKR